MRKGSYLTEHLRVVHGRKGGYNNHDGDGNTAEIVAAAVIEAALVAEVNAPEVTYHCSMDGLRSWGICPK
jgi:hypothetical protein